MKTAQSVYGKKINKFKAECRKRGLKPIRTKLYEDHPGDGDTAYLAISYPLDFYFSNGFGCDNLIHKLLIDTGLTKYFRESGSGAGFGVRDVGYYETQASLKRRYGKKV